MFRRQHVVLMSYYCVLVNHCLLHYSILTQTCAPLDSEFVKFNSSVPRVPLDPVADI